MKNTHENLMRDLNNNSLINTSEKEYQEYLTKRNLKIKENQKIQNLEDDFANIKSDIDEIKMLLKELM
ncbi:MAG: hypothetical protein ACO3UU_15445, partial [Minisyncoccia bacterium]